MKLKNINKKFDKIVGDEVKKSSICIFFLEIKINEFYIICIVIFLKIKINLCYIVYVIYIFGY